MGDPRTPLVGVGHLTLLDVPPPDWVSLAADTGFDAVGIRAAPAAAQEDVWPLADGSSMLRETLQRLADTGVRVLEVEIVRLTPECDPRGYSSLLETGEALGARYLTVFVDDADTSRAADNLAVLAQAARPHGLRISVEALPFLPLRSVAAAAALVGPVGGGVIVDPLHLRRCGEGPQEVAALDPAVYSFFQLCDAPLEAPQDLRVPAALPRNQSLAGGDRALEGRTGRLVPGEGELPLRELLSIKPDSVPVSVEAPNLAMSAQLGAAAFLRRIRRAVERLVTVESPPSRLGTS